MEVGQEVWYYSSWPGSLHIHLYHQLWIFLPHPLSNITRDSSPTGRGEWNCDVQLRRHLAFHQSWKAARPSRPPPTSSVFGIAPGFGRQKKRRWGLIVAIKWPVALKCLHHNAPSKSTGDSINSQQEWRKLKFLQHLPSFFNCSAKASRLLIGGLS